MFDVTLLNNPFDGTQACVDTDPEVFFPEPNDRVGIMKAKKICEGCPLQIACLEHVLWETEIEGIWGGTTARQRQTLRTAARKAIR